jgi:hypothetical protein
MKHALLHRDFGQVRTVVVLGVGRGGTSVVAGCLRVLGVCMGRDIHPLKHEWSPAVYLHDQIDFAPTLRNIAAMDAEHPRWGWKSPRDFGLLEKVAPFLRDPGFIFVTRDILESALSGFAYQQMPLELSLFEAALVYRKIAETLRLLPWPALVVSYSDLLQKPAEFVALLAAFLDLEPQDEMRARAIQFIQPGVGGYRPADAKPGDPPGQIAPEDLRLDAERLAIAVGNRYGREYAEHFDLTLAKTRALARNFAARSVTTQPALALKLLEQLAAVFSSPAAKNLPIAPNECDSLRAAGLRTLSEKNLSCALSSLLDDLESSAHKAKNQLDARLPGSGLRDFKNVRLSLQILLRVRATLERAHSDLELSRSPTPQ